MKPLIFALISINFFLYYIIFDFLTNKNSVSFLDVGQGQSVLIKSNKNIFLYDTGNKPYLLLSQIDKKIPFYNKKIDILFISHPDKDHYGAVFEVLKRYKVRLIGINNTNSEDSGYQNFINLAQSKNIPILILKKGEEIKTNELKFLILNSNKEFKKDNDNSLIVKVIGKNSYLLTGDIEKEAIKDLIECCSKILNSDYFLVPHHGSKYSINEEFYKLINPKVSIIQVGINKYGHPHKETIETLKKFSQIIWRTDLMKELKINE